jgi:hypothetical protein
MTEYTAPRTTWDQARADAMHQLLTYGAPPADTLCSFSTDHQTPVIKEGDPMSFNGDPYVVVTARANSVGGHDVTVRRAV